MSVDDRPRAWFAEADESWDHRTEVALTEVGRRHTRGVLVRRGLAAGVLAAAVATGAVLVTSARDGRDAAPDPVVPPSTGQVDRVELLDGRWRTELLDEADLREALGAAGDGQYADQVLGELPPPPFRLVWRIEGAGTAQLRVVVANGSSVLDEQAISVAGDRVVLTPRFADGVSVHRPALEGGRFTLAFVSSTEGRADGVPGAVWQRLLYDAFPYARD